MSGGHSVIQNNCHYIFIYSFSATPLNYHGYNFKGFRQTFIWSQHTNVNLRVNYGCIEPLLFKRERMKMQSREQASQDVWSESQAVCTRPAQGSLWHMWRQHTLSGWPPTGRPVGFRHPPEGTTLGQTDTKTCQVKGTLGDRGKALCRHILLLVIRELANEMMVWSVCKLPGM